MLGPFGYKRGKLPGPGALEFAFQRATFDPHVAVMGSGIGAQQMQLLGPAPVQVIQASAAYNNAGVETGQMVSQPLLTGF
jgi:hypothetical protein